MAYAHCRPSRPEPVDIDAIMRSCLYGERPPNGLWRWAGISIDIVFFSDNKIGGGGSDDVGDYYISGSWGKNSIKIIINYIAQYKITFEGSYKDGKITGKCLKENDGSEAKFELVYCGKEGKATPTSGKWSGFVYKSGKKISIEIDFDFGSSPYKAISGRGKDENGNFRIKGKLEGRALRLLRQNVVYYGVMNEAGTAVVGMFLDTGMCWTEGRFIFTTGGGSITPAPSGAAEPISGIWFWLLGGQPDYRCYLQLMFHSKTVTGKGRDETGYFTITGSWSGSSISFTKSTTSITYTGTISVENNVISGQTPDGGTFDIAFFMEFAVPEIPFHFPKKDIFNGQQCAIKLFQEIQSWLSRRRVMIQEYRLLIQRIQQAKSGSLTAKFEGDIVDEIILTNIALGLLTLLSGGSTTECLLARFAKTNETLSFTSEAYSNCWKTLESYRSASGAETLKDLVEEDVIASRFIYFLTDTLLDISEVLSSQCTAGISADRITRGLMFQAATGIDIISYAFPGENAAPVVCAPEYEHGNLIEIETAVLEIIGIITELHRDANEKTGGTVGLGIKITELQSILSQSSSDLSGSLEQCMTLLENNIAPYVALHIKTEQYLEKRESISRTLTTETVITVEFVQEMLGVLQDFNSRWCQAVTDAGLLEVLAVTMTKVYPAIHQKVQLMMNYHDPNSPDAAVDILDIVVVGEAAVGLPAVNRSLMFPVPTLQDVVLYEPYGCSIDQSTILGIASGLINPSSRQFDSDAEFPSSWNSLLSGPTEDLPTIYLNQTCISEIAYTDLQDILQQFPETVQRTRLVLPFFTASESDSLPPVPLWLFSSACSVAGMVSGVNVRVHLATSLPVPDPTPEVQTLCETQYMFSQTNMRCDVAQLHLEGVDQSWVSRFLQNEALTSYFSSTTSHTRNMTFEGGVITITSTTTSFG